MSYPRLYAADEATKSNAFQTLGIGVLGDAISCTVTEERNGTYELEMEYPVDGKRFKDLANDKLIVAKPSEIGNEQIFRIYKIEKPIDGKVTVNAEHISYLLNKAVCLPFEAASADGAFQLIKSNLLWQTDNPNFPTFPFTFWSDNTGSGTISIDQPTAVRSVLGGQENSILDAITGEYEFDNFQVKFFKERGSDKHIYLRYGKNITDLTDTDDISNVYTGIVPYWKGSLTRKTVDADGNDTTESYDVIVYTDNKVLWSDHTTDFAYPLAIPVDFSSDIEVQDDRENDKYATEADVRVELQKLAEDYLKNNSGWKPSDNLEVSFTNLWDTDEYENFKALQRVGLCDTVHVIYPVLGVDVSMKVIKTEYNVLLNRYEKIELGEAKSSMTSSVINSASKAEQDVKDLANQTKSDLKKAADYATDMINGKINNLAGAHEAYVVFNRNSKGGINEILIMDTPDKSTAVNVWRWNGGGFGHSHSGYNGPFDDVAITQDGRINASMITTGILTSIMIRTASVGKRIVIMNGDATISGYDNDTLKSTIDLVNENGDMLLDAVSSINVRTPAIWVEGASHGDQPSTLTKTHSGSLQLICDLAKRGSREPEGCAPEQEVQEVDFSNFSEYNVYCMLPVKLKIKWTNLGCINGFLTTTTTRWGEWM